VRCYRPRIFRSHRISPLYSLPKRLGKANALLVSRVMHTAMVALLVGVGALQGLNTLYYVGVGVAAILIAYEQSLVKPDDLRRVNLAFFTLNGWVSINQAPPVDVSVDVVSSRPEELLSDLLKRPEPACDLDFSRRDAVGERRFERP